MLIFNIVSILIPLTNLAGRTDAASRPPVNLYDKEPAVVALDATNFDKTVYNASVASFVEFYAHWCGACRKVKAKIIELGKQSERWHNQVIRVAAVNCGDSLNENLCHSHEIAVYPTLKLFGPRHNIQRHGIGMQVI